MIPAFLENPLLQCCVRDEFINSHVPLWIPEPASSSRGLAPLPMSVCLLPVPMAPNHCKPVSLPAPLAPGPIPPPLSQVRLLHPWALGREPERGRGCSGSVWTLPWFPGLRLMGKRWGFAGCRRMDRLRVCLLLEQMDRQTNLSASPRVAPA